MGRPRRPVGTGQQSLEIAPGEQLSRSASSSYPVATRLCGSSAEVAPHVGSFGTPHKTAEQWKITVTYYPFDDPSATRW
jgi:hypothetical protein